MKDLILTFVCVLTLFIAGCGHSGNFTASGKVLTIGTPEIGITYVNGLMSVTGSRENTESVIEFGDDDGISGAPTAELKSVRTIRYKTGVQLNGYAVDLAKKAPDAIVEYLKIMPDLNTAPTWDSKETLKSSSSSSKSDSKSSTTGYIEYLKEKLKGIVGKDKEIKETIKGDGEYKELYKDNSIEAQAALTAELLKYADDETGMPTSGETIKDCLVHYAGRLAQLKAKGISHATKITLDRATIKNGKLTYLMLRLLNESTGTYQDEECANCFELEEK